MANFYTNDLSIAASEESMKNVLRTIAHNLRTRRAATKFDVDTDSLDTVLALYGAVYPYVDAFFHLIFTPSEGDPTDWDEAVCSNTRGMSDTGNVSLLRDLNNRYVLEIRYATAWGANRDDVHALIESFPEGEYGYALLGADEGDGYWVTDVDLGSTTGGRIYSKNRDFQSKEPGEVIAEKRRIATDVASEEASMMKLAYKCGLSDWFEYEWRSDRRELIGLRPWTLHEGPSYLDGLEYADCPFGSRGFVFKRRKRKYLTDEERSAFVREALGFIDCLPMRCDASYNRWIRGKETPGLFDVTVPGSEVAVGTHLEPSSSDLGSYFYLSGPDTYSMASLDLEVPVLNGSKTLTETDKRSLALLEPWIKAVIECFNPCAFLDDEDNYLLDEASAPASLISVRLELKEVELEQMINGLYERVDEAFAAGKIEPEEDM